MSKMYKSTVDMGGIPKTVVVINYKKEQEVDSKNVDSIHHIHLLDRSCSMSRDISNLIENVKKTLDIMGDKDYVSIVWFSGVGEYKTLIKGAQKNEGLYTLLDSIKSCVGTTCFSEALKEVGDIITDLETICPNFNVTLFTDGYPVTQWDDEEDRAGIEVDAWKDKALALNTIGYGSYYNQEFLKGLSEKTDYGVMMHSSEIDEYESIWTGNFERVSDLVVDNVTLSANGSDILYINSKSTKMNYDEINLKALENKKNQFVIVSDDPSFKFTYNDTIIESDDISMKVHKDTLKTVSYAYAYENYYKGKRQIALDIIAKTLNDKYLVDNQMKAFTFDEVAEYMKIFNTAVLSTKGRYLDGECASDYLPKADAFCLMDLLRLLMSSNNYYCYSKDYKRMGLKSHDKFNFFTWDKDQEITTPMSELSMHKEKLNMSIQSTVKGSVSINPKQAKKLELNEEVKAVTFKKQTFIMDGRPYMDTITVILDDETLDQIKVLKIKGLLENPEKHEKGTKVKINLKTLPIINRMYLGMADTLGVLDTTTDLLELEARQRVLNALIQRVPVERKAQTIRGITYSVEQLECLEEHGLNSKMWYSPIKVEQDKKEGKDFYESKNFKFQIKGAASIPKFDDVLERLRDGKKLNLGASLMNDYLMSLQEELNRNLEQPVSLLADTIKFEGDKHFFTSKLDDVKATLIEKRIQMFSLKMAKVLTGDWFEDVVPAKNGDYHFTKDDVTLVIKADKKKVYYS